MIDKKVYTKEYIKFLQDKYKVDPSIIERTIYAFGLVESLLVSNVDFVFKGGTCLLLLLDKVYRLSTDVDIIVKTSFDIDEYIEKASVTYPFIRFEEDFRKSRGKIIKRHFSFFYNSLNDNTKNVKILLDVVYQDEFDITTVKKELNNELLITTGMPIFVNVPIIDSMIADKLSAFAPKTIGILKPTLQKNNYNSRVDIIKQLFDIGILYDYIEKFDIIRTSYIKIANTQIKYRELDITYSDCLKDSYEELISILSKGKIHNSDELEYKEGIKRIRNFLINLNFTNENVYKIGSKVLYLISCILTNSKPNKYLHNHSLIVGELNVLNYISKVDRESFNRIAEAILLYDSIIV